MNRIYSYRSAITAVCSACIIVCFFLPWITVHMKTAAAVNGLFGREMAASTFTTSGAGVPRLANGESAKTFIQVSGMFFGSVANADKKSYLVWIVPLLSIAMLAASLKFKGKWIVSAILGSLCAAIAIGVTCKLLLTDLNGLLIRVQLCWALWAILLAFAAISLAHFMSIPVERKQSLK